MTATAEARRRALGAFLRAERERLTAEAVGLPPGGRRRTPGLRREELAQLAGFSATWYTWLEQGRDVAVSAPALARLAAALRLTRTARAYVFDLAGRHDPAPPAEDDAALPPALPACLGVIASPAYVLDRPWNLCAWNEAAARLFAGWLDRAGPHNLLRFVFLDPLARTLLPDWDARARRVLAEFRADCAAHLEDAPVRALLAGLQRDSADFAVFWRQHGVTGREGAPRAFRLGDEGLRAFDQTTFVLAGRADLRLVVLTSARADQPPDLALSTSAKTSRAARNASKPVGMPQ
jgi:transcriptional regulator with XRE-family HTH domain